MKGLHPAVIEVFESKLGQRFRSFWIGISEFERKNSHLILRTLISTCLAFSVVITGAHHAIPFMSYVSIVFGVMGLLCVAVVPSVREIWRVYGLGHRRKPVAVIDSMVEGLFAWAIIQWVLDRYGDAACVWIANHPTYAGAAVFAFVLLRGLLRCMASPITTTASTSDDDPIKASPSSRADEPTEVSGFLRDDDPLAVPGTRHDVAFAEQGRPEEKVEERRRAAREAGYALVYAAIGHFPPDMNEPVIGGQGLRATTDSSYAMLSSDLKYGREYTEWVLLCLLSADLCETFMVGAGECDISGELHAWLHLARRYMAANYNEIFFKAPASDAEHDHNIKAIETLCREQKALLNFYFKLNKDLLRELAEALRDEHHMRCAQEESFFERVTMRYALEDSVVARLKFPAGFPLQRGRAASPSNVRPLT